MSPVKKVALEADTLECSRCGGTEFTLEHVRRKGERPRVGVSGVPTPGSIQATCTACQCRSSITVTAARLAETAQHGRGGLLGGGVPPKKVGPDAG